MKIRISFLIMLSLVLITVLSCDKDGPTLSPDWTITQNPDYSVTMTAVVQLPKDMIWSIRAEDKLAAFVGDECRGIASLVNENVHFVLIRGKADEVNNVEFRYYSAYKETIYKTEDFLPFEPDFVFGTVDTPEILELQKMK